MLIFDEQLQEEYKKSDIILNLLSAAERSEDRQFTSHRWLLESLPKRMIYYHMYSDLLGPTVKRRKILDVGGGYAALTRILLKHHDYCTLDIMAHDDHESLKKLEKSLGKNFWINSDWYNFGERDGYDIVIANDLFPNVDQRLKLFLDKYLPACQEIRLSLTYYNMMQWYKVKRTDADEVFHMMAWDGLSVKHVLEAYAYQILEPKLDLLLHNQPSLFRNQRQVCLVNFRGKGRTS